MGKEIRMVWTGNDNCLFLYGIKKTGELVFRTSRNIKYLQTEKVTIDNGVAFINTYYFDARWLNNLPVIGGSENIN